MNLLRERSFSRCVLKGENGKNMKYRIKMYSQLLVAMANLISTTVCSFFVQSIAASMLILFLLVIEILAITQRPKRLFQKQLNDHFMIVHFPGSRWHGIFQKPTAVLTKADCSSVYRNLCKSMIDIFSFIQHEHGYYRTITHDIVKRRLEKEAKAGNIVVLTCEPAYRKDLSSIFHQAMQKVCLGCGQSKTCHHLLAAKKKRQFYYIEFYIPEHERSEGLPLA